MTNLRSPEKNTLDKVKKPRFKLIFFSGFFLCFFLFAGGSIAFINIFKFDGISLRDESVAIVGSPKNSSSEQTIEQKEDIGGNKENSEVIINDESIKKNEKLSVENGKDNIQMTGGNLSQENTGLVENLEGSTSFWQNGKVDADEITVNISYKDNSELPGFDPGSGYQKSPPNIGDFDNAIQIGDASLGSKFIVSKTKDIFINKKKYRSTFSMKADGLQETRASLNLDIPGISATAALLQFGLRDLDSGTTTLTYLVRIYGNGEILWSGQIKYDESQIASVILDIKDTEDLVIEYKVKESGGISTYDFLKVPLYFTEAKLLS